MEAPKSSWLPPRLHQYVMDHGRPPDPLLVELAEETERRLGATLEARLEPGGVIAVDNTLWGGAVADPDADDPTTNLLRRLNDDLVADGRFDTIQLPLGDGLTLLRRR